MTGSEGGSRRALCVVLIALALVGIALRCAAFRWNADLLHGDVNLHALAAREYAEHGRLHYPMKFDFRPEAEREAMTSPAILHPRGVPFVAGLVARRTRAEAYAVLRALSLGLGLGLLGFALRRAWRATALGVATAAFAMLALNPLHVDFSGNGSPYTGAALAVAVGAWWLGYGPRGPGRPGRNGALVHGALFGLLAGFALELHTTLLALPLAYVAFWIARRRELGVRALAGFALAFLAARVPSAAWTWSTLGAPTIPFSEWLRTYRFGLVEPALADGHVVLRTLPWSELSVRRYAFDVVASGIALVRGALVEGSPLLWPLVALGLLELRSDERKRVAALPFAFFLAIVLVWGMHEQRYLVVLLPGALALAGLGLARASRAGASRAGASRTGASRAGASRARAMRIAAGVCAVGTLAWFGAGLRRDPPNRYYDYPWEAVFAARYPEVRELALELARAEPGVVIGFDRSALGALYWHRRPYVDAPFAKRPALDALLARSLIAEYDVRYVWTPAADEERLREALPIARVVARRGEFAVLELER